MVKGFEGTLESIRHDYDRLIFIPSTDYLVVEGTSKGRMSGRSWAGGKTPGGRFCNVFKFRDGRISSLHIYLDPEYTGEDEARFRWGKDVSGESDEQLSGEFLDLWKDQLVLGTLNRYSLILKRYIFESSVRAGSPSFVAAPDGPETCP